MVPVTFRPPESPVLLLPMFAPWVMEPLKLVVPLFRKFETKVPLKFPVTAGIMVPVQLPVLENKVHPPAKVEYCPLSVPLLVGVGPVRLRS